jgi:DNA-binding transcriptional ArsR family regulator
LKEGTEIDDTKDLKTTNIYTGDELIKILEAIANPHRMKILALLSGRRIHVSQLAREVMISRPLLYMHLKRLEAAGLVTSKMEVSDDGKAMNYFQVIPFNIHINPENISEAVKTLTIKKSGSNDAAEEKGDK